MGPPSVGRSGRHRRRGRCGAFALPGVDPARRRRDRRAVRRPRGPRHAGDRRSSRSRPGHREGRRGQPRRQPSSRPGPRGGRGGGLLRLRQRAPRAGRCRRRGRAGPRRGSGGATAAGHGGRAAGLEPRPAGRRTGGAVGASRGRGAGQRGRARRRGCPGRAGRERWPRGGPAHGRAGAGCVVAAAARRVGAGSSNRSPAPSRLRAWPPTSWPTWERCCAMPANRRLHRAGPRPS